MRTKKYLVLFSLFAMNLIDQPAPTVVIEQGILSGKISEDGSFFEYLGIPYGTVNSTNRFLSPFPPPAWQGEYRATDEHHACLQDTFTGVVGSEDCLKINVYVPASATEPLPVMVYIHGGAFVFGSGGKLIYASDFLVKHNVILVTFNYRLGALGFLCLQTKEVPGNAGLKDQIAALRWVKKNIASFGGDPENVTLFGQSAGGASASFLIASKVTDGLFKRAIIQSGASTASWSINRNPTWIASLLAKSLGHETQDPNKLYEIFSQIPAKSLMSLKAKKPIEKFFETKLLHLPCVEKKYPDIEPAIDDLPYYLLKNHPKNISIIDGFNSREGYFLMNALRNDPAQSRNENYLFASDLEFESDDEASRINAEIHKFYFGDDLISEKHLANISDFCGNLYFETPAILEAEIWSQNCKLQVYNYVFNYSGGRNLLKTLLRSEDLSGAYHADEILYLFKGRVWPFPISDKDQSIISSMTKLWTNFAKYGDPTPDGSPLKWAPSSSGNMKILYIDENFKMGPIPNHDSYSMWREIYEKFRRKSPFPPPAWQGEYRATDEHHACLQDTFIGIVGSEDCQKINVYVPASATEPLPVMVYIHGGAFVFGSGGKLLYAPDFIIKHNVIVVTFNYRLGALGFLCLQTKEVPGNAGLKDQIAALRWVKKNIASFGGDPENVTLFGQSAGGASASFLIASKATNGLFKRAIIQSGASTASWSINRKPIWVASLLAKSLGHETEDPNKLYEIFSQIPAKSLTSIKAKKPLEMFFDTQLLHLPCVEKIYPDIEPAIDDLPYYLLKNHPKNINIIDGFNSREGHFLMYSKQNDSAVSRNGRYLFASDLEFESDNEAARVNTEVHKFYFGHDLISEKNMANISHFYSNLYFETPAILEAEIWSRNSKQQVYNYVFNYSGGRNLLKTLLRAGDISGACHADDILYLFKGRLWPFPISGNDQSIISSMTKLWTNFAKFGDPTPDGSPVKWSPSTSGNMKFLYIDKKFKMGLIPNHESYSMLREIYEKFRRKKYNN